MKSSHLGGAAFIGFIVLAFLAFTSLYTVRVTEFALPLRLGEPLNPSMEPGLYIKAPLLDTVVKVDKRLQDLEAPQQEVISADKKRLVIDTFARYRVVDPLRFYQTLNSTEAASSRLTGIVVSAMRRVLSQASFISVVRDDRDELMQKIKDEMNRETGNFGIVVVDVRIRRADLPDENRKSVFGRMATERNSEAAQIRAQGSEQAKRIKADSERARAKILGEANGSAEQIRGAADAERTRIFAEAYGKDADFFAFFRSMQAYEEALKGTDTRLVLSPDSPFFRYLYNPSGVSGKPADRLAPAQ